MSARPATIRETSIRAAILPGAVVAVLALVGVDVASKASFSHERLAKAAWVSARSTSACTGIVRTATARVTWTAAALLLLLAVSQPMDIAPPECRTGANREVLGAAGNARLRRRHSISYHAGGRYGP